jgi:hypothetical protein
MGKMVDMLERRAKKARKTNMAELKDDTSTTKLERQDVTEVSGGRNPNGGQLQIDVVEGGNVAFNVTPKGTVGPDGTDRRLVWTIPVRKGQKIRLTMYGGSSAFELSSVRGQFIYFGVAE